MNRFVMVALIHTLAIVLGSAASNAEQMHNSYRDAIKVCGAEWKTSDAKKEVQKGQGREAWNAFRKECIARNPYHTNKTRQATKATD